MLFATGISENFIKNLEAGLVTEENGHIDRLKEAIPGVHFEKLIKKLEDIKTIPLHKISSLGNYKIELIEIKEIKVNDLLFYKLKSGDLCWVKVTSIKKTKNALGKDKFKIYQDETKLLEKNENIKIKVAVNVG